MYYKSAVEGVVRVDPSRFSEDLKKVVTEELRRNYENRVIDQLGRVIAIQSIKNIEDGIIIHGDGAAFHNVTFNVVHYLPETNDLIEGEIKDIAKFGAFVDFGPFEGMIHISQTMDDFVSFSKEGTLLGKDSKKVLKVKDKVRARIIAVSIKNTQEPKIGMTMRQPYLGKSEWLDEIRKVESKVN
ncbi:MAG: DNA-directed RNA polymerase [Candidatus Nanoarchaeia archaeon]|jgi:DNA-directed RNA polymerase subunit E'|nr:DNA-directed RNA polymerase [Candidatus Nanoarchaeia archaeon]|tara:strand:+ start:3621 stop:4175 length:555 start_codon:yes stop_codon:yes gene_type:complete